jgi:hypothetical protein
VTRRRRCAALLLAIVVATLASACSNDPDTPPPSPSPFFTTGPSGASGAPTGASGAPSGATATGPVPPPGPSGSTGSLPTASPGSGTGNINAGSLTIRTSGSIRVTKTLKEMISTVYGAPPSGMALVWTAGGVDPSTVGFGGLSFTGTEPTSPTLIVTITVPTRDGGFESFTSQSGECNVTISTATTNALRGAFRCSSLSSGSATIGAVGSFQASG